MIALYGVGAFVSIAITGKFYRHYFQIGLPPLVVAGGWATAMLSRNKIRLKMFFPHLAAALVLFFIIGNQISYYSSAPGTELKGKYAELYLVTQKLGRKLASILKEDETMFQWGAESGLYFFSQRRAPASIHGWSHFNQTFGDNFTRQTLNTLKASPPDLMILAKYFITVKPDHPIQKWIFENYGPINGLSEEETKYFVLMALRGSELEARIPSLN